MEIVTRKVPGDVVYWVHCSGKVYKGTVQAVTLCEEQGALYCYIYSPSFRRNPYPCVHYSAVFPDRNQAKDYAAYQTENPDGVLPICMGCHYNAKERKNCEDED